MSSSLIRRSILTRFPIATRPLSTSIAYRKTVTESVKETVDSVDKTAGQTLAAGIQKTQEAAGAVKETVGGAVGNAQKNAPSADEAKGIAKGKTEEVKGKAKGAASEISK
ncbi:hypothetical protein ABW20_dc0104669 [Dactylellina cionopaga]|nr:hypothetical protein ABW20_dc0104669 [Dactylellina cionopaga]